MQTNRSLIPFIFSKVGIAGIYAYRALHPLLGTRTCCRFTVSCSEFSLQQLQTVPFFQACPTIIKRLLACQPFGSVIQEKSTNSSPTFAKPAHMLVDEQPPI